MSSWPVRRRVGIGAVGAGVLIVLFSVIGSFVPRRVAVASADPKSDPKGDNGTVKLHQVGAPEAHPDEDPHLTCPFEIDFYNFDANQHLHVTLAGHPPSGNGQVVFTTTLTADPGKTDPDNPGAGNDFDGEIVITTLDLSGLTAQQNQGYHLKLTVTDDGGKDLTKFKTFWVNGCGPTETTTSTTTTMPPTTTTMPPTTTTMPPTTTTTVPPTTTTVQPTTTTVPPTTTTEPRTVTTLAAPTTTTAPPTTTTEPPTTTTAVPPTTTTTAATPGGPATAVLGEQITSPTASPAAAGEQLPRTGASPGGYLRLGITLILTGLLLVLYPRRRRTA